MVVGSVLSHGAPDSPVRHRTSPDSSVNYSGAPLEIPEGSKFSVECPGAPDTVRWPTGQSGVPDQGAFRVIFCSLV
jgi:hypothetical protein